MKRLFGKISGGGFLRTSGITFAVFAMLFLIAGLSTTPVPAYSKYTGPDKLCEIYRKIENAEQTDYPNKKSAFYKDYFFEADRLLKENRSSECFDLKLMVETASDTDCLLSQKKKDNYSVVNCDQGLIPDEVVDRFIKYRLDEDITTDYMAFISIDGTSDEYRKFVLEDIFKKDPDNFLKSMKAFNRNQQFVILSALSWGIENNHYDEHFKDKPAEKSSLAIIKDIYGDTIDYHRYRKRLERLTRIMDKEYPFDTEYQEAFKESTAIAETEKEGWTSVRIDNNTTCKAMASSQIDSKHSVDNAFDDKRISWIGNNDEGTGEWIHIRCNAPINFCWINFDYEYDKIYSRIKTLSIEVDGETYNSIGDMDIYSQDWRTINHRAVGKNALWKPVAGKDILLLITDIYPGTTHKNLSIESIEFYPIFDHEEDMLEEPDIKTEDYPDFYMDDISGIKLGDELSGRYFLMKHGVGGVIYQDEKMIFDYAPAYLNKDHSQCLLLIKYPGGMVGHYADEMYVWYNQPISSLIDDYEGFLKNLDRETKQHYLWEIRNWNDLTSTDSDIPPLELDYFGSDRGIKPGITSETLLAALGSPHKKVTTGNNEVYIYEVPYNYDGPVEENKNVEGYEGVYVFSNDRLIWFKTGFSCP